MAENIFVFRKCPDWLWIAECDNRAISFVAMLIVFTFIASSQVSNVILV